MVNMFRLARNVHNWRAFQLNDDLIWFAGHTDELIKKILDRIIYDCGPAGVIADPAPFVLFELKWMDAHFAIRSHSQLGLVITRPDGTSDYAGWRAGFQKFYDEVVRPLADTTGGVATGLSVDPEEFGDSTSETMPI
jgi:hypothetical protein